MASEFVQRIADQWRHGLSTRLARKALRKKGIHPWSLLVPLEARDWSRMIQELDAPRWIVNSSLDDHQMPYEGGMVFRNLLGMARLPEGLVLPHFKVCDAPRLRRLPRRAWTWDLTLVHCSALRGLPSWRSRPSSLDVLNCPRLMTIPPEMGPMNYLGLRGCEQLVDIPLLEPLLNPRNQVTLRDLPRLVRIGICGRVQKLFVWNCPSLRCLHGFTVTEVLEVNRCQALVSPPKFAAGIQGHIRDCIALASVDQSEIMPGDRGLLHYQPLRGACQLPPVRPVPAAQVVEVRPLFGSFLLDEDSAWPWPPRPGNNSSSSQDLLLQALGLSPLDRIRAHAQSGVTLDEAVGCFLDHTENPAHALGEVRRLIHEVLRWGHRNTIEVILRQFDLAGLGLLSLWFDMGIAEREALVSLLPACRTLSPLSAISLEDFSEASGGIRGNLVLASSAHLVPGLGPKSIGDRVWVEGDLAISDCTEVEMLPDLLVVKGDFWISRCPALRCFPRRLEVGGDLTVGELPRLERSLCRARVGARTRVSSVPALRLTPQGSWEA